MSAQPLLLSLRTLRSSLWMRRGGVALALVFLSLFFFEFPLGSTRPRAPFGTNDLTSDGGRIHALLLNGGGSASKNYQSHLLHLRSLVSLLRARGVSGDQVSVFASDGDDPGRDLAARHPDANEYFWILEGVPVRGKLANRIRLVNSEIDGVSLRPATNEALEGWFRGARDRLRSGDTLLVYVTDHGGKNPEDLSNNSISLWHQHLSVRRLERLIAMVPQGVRVVMMMSQCFSGSFAGLLYDPNRPGQPYGDVCGYFSSTADRPAYGCYPENRGKDNVGHSFRFLEALSKTDSLLEAHAHVLLADRTPDVPHRTSDAYARDLLAATARRTGKPIDFIVDSLLPFAYRDEPRFGAAFEEIDRLGEAFGTFGPRSLAELDRMAANVPPMARALDSHARSWKSVLTNLQREHYSRFLYENGHWRDGVDPSLIDQLPPRQRRSLARWLTADLVDFALEKRPKVWQRLLALHTFAEESSLAAYRMRVREAAGLRMRMMLQRIAAEVWLDTSGTDAQRASFDALVACEDLSLGQRRGWQRSMARGLENYPPLDIEIDLIEGVLPGWLGLSYGPTNAELRQRHDLPRGAVTITSIDAASPAERSGLRVGDVVLGPPEEPFVERDRLREWAMTSIGGERRPLLVLRDEGYLSLDVEVGRPPDDPARLTR